MRITANRNSAQMVYKQCRNFSMAKQKRMQAEHYFCPSLTSLHHFAQMALFDNFSHFAQQVQNQPPRYGLQLLRCADNLLGSKVKRKSSALAKSTINEVFDIEQLKRRVYLRAMEDIDDPAVMTLADIVELINVLHEYGPHKPKENELAVTNEVFKALYLELLENRAHSLTKRQTKHFETEFEKFFDTLGRKKLLFRPDFKKQYNEVKEAQSASQFLKQQLDGSSDDFEDIMLEPEKHSVSLLFSALHISFQLIERHKHSSMEIVLDRVSRAKPDLVLLPITGQPNLLKTRSEVDQFLEENVVRHSDHFKLSRAENAVEERVHGMKRINTVYSTLLSFSSQGYFGETKVGLYSPTVNQQIQALSSHNHNDKLYEQARTAILLDRLNWISELVDNEYCP